MNIMKRYLAIALAAVMTIIAGQEARAQYWQAASQLQNLLSPALSGSGRYKGSVELMGVAGIDDSKLNHIEISTSQGYQYNSWFYMGAGIGIDIVMNKKEELFYTPDFSDYDFWNNYNANIRATENTGVMLPIFTDFRFNIPFGQDVKAAAMYIDLRLGASWLLGDKYIDIRHGWLGHSANFYFRPTIGVRFPLSSSNPNRAINIGLSYLLLSADSNNSYYGSHQILSSLGASISFEW